MEISFDTIPQSLLEISNRLSAIEEKLENNQTNNEDLISVADACQYLKICKATFYELAKIGKVETIKVGRRRLVKTQSLKSIK